uniref:Uncharacterized protein n=1 Tax=Anguilla anguilla TaxID=7936 RepID=A0A0E9REV9_ANGAN
MRKPCRLPCCLSIGPPDAGAQDYRRHLSTVSSGSFFLPRMREHLCWFSQMNNKPVV